MAQLILAAAVTVFIFYLLLLRHSESGDRTNFHKYFKGFLKTREVCIDL